MCRLALAPAVPFASVERGFPEPYILSTATTTKTVDGLHCNITDHPMPLNLSRVPGMHLGACPHQSVRLQARGQPVTASFHSRRAQDSHRHCTVYSSRQRGQHRVHASSASLTADAADGDVAGGLRCWLVPADDGGYDQICVTEGKIFIGAGESEYYFSETKGVCALAPSGSTPACMSFVV